jgi:integrase
MKSYHPKVDPYTQTVNGTEYTSFRLTYKEGGKYVRKFFKDRSEALAKQQELETGVVNQGIARRNINTILQEPVVRKCELAVELLNNKFDIVEAVEFFLKYKAISDITLERAIEKFLEFQESQIRDYSLSEYRRTLNTFSGFIGEVLVGQITHDDIERFLNSKRSKDGAKKAAKRTWNNNRKSLHRFFGWCAERPQNFVQVNPVSDIKSMREEITDPTAMTAEKTEKVMRYVEATDADLVRYFALSIFAGIRPTRKHGELGKLDSVDNISINGSIRITAANSKTSRSRNVTIQPNLRAWLDKFPGQIFPPNASKRISAIKDKFGIGCKDSSANKDILRHTFCSMSINREGGSFTQTAQEAGNSESILRRDYVSCETTREDAAKFWNIYPK